MTKGGARARSGPPADPGSGRSEKRGFTLTALPSEGYKRRPPAFPLPKLKRFKVSAVTGGRVIDQAGTTAFRAREMQIWNEAWKTPQACAWSVDPWRWSTIGEFCRVKCLVEAEPEASAALLSRLREYRNEIGLSPDGLRVNGWAIAVDQVAPRRTAKKATKEEEFPPLRLQSAPK